MFDVKRWYLGSILLTLAVLPGAAGAQELRLLAIAVNEHRTDVVAPVLMLDGQVHFTPDVFERLRIRLPNMTAVEHRGARYYPLNGNSDSTHRIDEQDQTLHLAVPPKYLISTKISARQRRRIVPTDSELGGFLNYDLLGQWLEQENEYSADGFFEVGIYGGELFANATQAVRGFDDEPDYLRLETVLVRDVPEERLSYRFGDSINRGGEWGRPVRFGGIQIGTNFAIRPDFVTFPTASLSGAAALPSSVDVLIGNSSRFVDEFPAGPFVIEDLPTVTGAGEVTAVVTDVLGRETVISQPYYTSPSLLRRALHDYSFEVGLLRKEFGAESNDYDDDPFFTGTYRYGYTDQFTAEAHAEFETDRQAFGVSGATLIDVYGVLSGSVAGSIGDDVQGGLFQLGFERSARDISMTAFGRITTGDYLDLGVDDDLQSADAEGRFRVTLPFEAWGTFSSSYTYRHFKQDDDNHVLSGGYSVGIPLIGAFNITALRTFGAASETVVTANLTIPLGPRTSASGRVQYDKGPDELLWTVDARHTAPLEGGFGGFASYSENGFTRSRGELSYSSQVGVASAAASRVNGETGVRLNAVGGVAVADGGTFLSRRIVDSFAVASVPDQEGVRIYSENRLVGETDADGRLLIHNLRAYEANRISIDPRDLPLDADVSRTSIAVAPRARSGVTVEFPVEASRSVLLTAILDDGSPVPPGAAVRVGEGAETFPVGFDGQVQLRGARLGERISIDLGRGLCFFTLDREVPDEPLADLGRFTCGWGQP